ncbi:arginase-1-like [Acropora millepora]|uniref:arginase-1-like n=1 Tax=Acropora millepora TaxID=45264 RepID=UPI001CF22E1C|nr:arginase-1-like [Acropora millepora]
MESVQIRKTRIFHPPPTLLQHCFKEALELPLNVSVRGGLTLDEGIYIAQIVAGTDCLSAVDTVEFNPANGTEEEVTRAAMNAMKDLLQSSIQRNNCCVYRLSDAEN